MCGGNFENRVVRVLIIEVRSSCSCGGRVPGSASIFGGAFSLFVESVDEALFWLDVSAICVDCVWKGCMAGMDGMENSLCTIYMPSASKELDRSTQPTSSSLGIIRDNRAGHCSLQGISRQVRATCLETHYSMLPPPARVRRTSSSVSISIFVVCDKCEGCRCSRRGRVCEKYATEVRVRRQRHETTSDENNSNSAISRKTR